MERPAAAGFWLRGGALCFDFVFVTFMLVAANLVLHSFIPPKATAFVGMVLYFGLFPAYLDGQTIGKMIASVRIVGTDDAPLALRQAVFRAFAYYLSGLPLLLGYVAAAFTPDKKALHDYIVGTRVVKVSEIGWLRWIPLALAMPLMAGMLAVPTVYRTLQAKKMADRVPMALGTSEDHAAAQAAPKLDGTRGALTGLRLGVMFYKKAHDGALPPDLAVVVAEKHIRQISQARTGVHAPSADVMLYDGRVCERGPIQGNALEDTGGWGYVADPSAPCAGKVFVDCAHEAEPGAAWFSQ